MVTGLLKGKIDFEAGSGIQAPVTPTDYPEHQATELRSSSWSLALSLHQQILRILLDCSATPPGGEENVLIFHPQAMMASLFLQPSFKANVHAMVSFWEEGM